MPMKHRRKRYIHSSITSNWTHWRTTKNQECVYHSGKAKDAEVGQHAHIPTKEQRTKYVRMKIIFNTDSAQTGMTVRTSTHTTRSNSDQEVSCWRNTGRWGGRNKRQVKWTNRKGQRRCDIQTKVRNWKHKDQNQVSEQQSDTISEHQTPWRQAGMAQNAFRKTPSRKDSAEVLGTHAANPILAEQQRKQCEGIITIKSREEREECRKFRNE